MLHYADNVKKCKTISLILSVDLSDLLQNTFPYNTYVAGNRNDKEFLVIETLPRCCDVVMLVQTDTNCGRGSVSLIGFLKPQAVRKKMALLEG